jgi:tRNA(fMet)-specific endonuclease VapC
MMPYAGMLDANILSAIMRDREGSLLARAEEVGARRLCTSIVVAGELRFGAAKVDSPRLKREVEGILARIAVLPIEPPTDVVYADIRADLQKRGRLIGPNDLWIAAHALALDLTLVTANTGEFSRIEGLRIENWLA